MAVERSLVSGSMKMLILNLLSEKDMYGYEMIDTLRQKSQNVFELKAGTLYPLLHDLEEKGLLVVYEQEFKGKTRKYYSLTKQGKRYRKNGKSILQRYRMFLHWRYDLWMNIYRHCWNRFVVRKYDLLYGRNYKII